jgi:hypothetical protein
MTKKQTLEEMMQDVENDLHLTPTNCKDKALELPRLHNKYMRSYAIAKSKLKGAKNRLATRKSDLLVKYKYKDDYTWDKKDQLEIRIHGNVSYQELDTLVSNLENEVEFFKGVVNTINNMNFSISNYHKLVAWQEGN